MDIREARDKGKVVAIHVLTKDLKRYFKMLGIETYTPEFEEAMNGFVEAFTTLYKEVNKPKNKISKLNIRGDAHN